MILFVILMGLAVCIVLISRAFLADRYRRWQTVRRNRAIPSANFISVENGPIGSGGKSQDAGKVGITTMSGNGFFSRVARAFGGTSAPVQAPLPAAPAVPPVDVDYEDDRVPGGAKERIRRILACLTEVEAAMAREQIPGFTRVDVDQLRGQHLPKLVKSYIDIPPAHRSEIFRKTGKSASFILDEGLDQMQHRIDEILSNLAQQDIDAFTNNTRFIGERYAHNNPFD